MGFMRWEGGGPSGYSEEGFMVPFPPIDAVGEIDELIRQFFPDREETGAG